MYMGTPVRYVQAGRNEWPGQGGGCGECVRVHWYTVCKQAGNELPGQARGCGECIWEHWYAMCKR